MTNNKLLLEKATRRCIRKQKTGHDTKFPDGPPCMYCVDSVIQAEANKRKKKRAR